MAKMSKSVPTKTVTSKTATSKAATAKGKADKAAAGPETPAKPATTKPAIRKKTVVPVVRKKEFIDRVVTTSGLKKQQVKSVAEAVLAAMGEALLRGEDLVVPPLGKLHTVKRQDKETGAVLVLKLRLAGKKPETAENSEKTGTSPLAEAED